MYNILYIFKIGYIRSFDMYIQSLKEAGIVNQFIALHMASGPFPLLPLQSDTDLLSL